LFDLAENVTESQQ